MPSKPTSPNGTRDIVGWWAGEHGDGEGAKYWIMQTRRNL